MHQSADVSYRHAGCIKAQCLGVLDDQPQMRSMMSQLASSFAVVHGHTKTVYALDPDLSPAMKDLVHLLEMAIAFARRAPGPARTGKWQPWQVELKLIRRIGRVPDADASNSWTGPLLCSQLSRLPKLGQLCSGSERGDSFTSDCRRNPDKPSASFRARRPMSGISAWRGLKKAGKRSPAAPSIRF